MHVKPGLDIAIRPERGAAAVGIIDDNETRLFTKWITASDYSASAGEARIAGTGVPVRALIGHLPAADNDVCQVAKDYELPVDAVRAAIAYYQRNREAIDARLAQNATTIA